jgi:hypothetical protein
MIEQLMHMALDHDRAIDANGSRVETFIKQLEIFRTVGDENGSRLLRLRSFISGPFCSENDWKVNDANDSRP